MQKKKEIQTVIITGMSGAGKTVAIQSFEDLGFYCVDNMPPTLLPTFVDLMSNSSNKLNKIALVMDLRGRDFFDSLAQSLDEVSNKANQVPQILFLDADDTTLVRRYKESRRSHPLSKGGAPLEGIHQERKILEQIKNQAQVIIDTTNLKPKDLREKIQALYSNSGDSIFTGNVMSFGFKHGMPIDADLVFDVRFLRNPYYVEHMRPMTGLDEEVSTYVLRWQDTQKLIEKLIDLLNFMLPHYKKEGKSQLVIAIGCTGGQHRSVAISEFLGNYLKNDYPVRITHRDIEKKKGVK